MNRPRNAPSPGYLIWQRGDGDPRKPENWRNASPLEALTLMQQAFTRNLGVLAKRFPDSPINGASVWWTYLHREGWTGIDLGRVRVRRLDPP